MPLINLQTDLKSLKYSKDRPQSGYSGQPYIQKSLNPDEEEFPNNVPESKDFLLRGGLRAPLAAADDDIRLSKYFTDFKSPSGFLFIAKQNLLSQTAVRTQASRGPGLNEGVYTPLSTLIQAGSGFLGEHVYKQGLNPFQGVRTYMDVVNGDGISGDSIKNISKNRLIDFYENKIQIKTSGDTLYSYGGGPGSVLGIGNTNIKLASERTGINNIELSQVGFIPGAIIPGRGTQPNKSIYSIFPIYNQNYKGSIVSPRILRNNPSTVSTYYQTYTSGNVNLESLYNNIEPQSGSSVVLNSTVYPNSTNPFEQKGNNRIYDNKTVTWTQTDIGDQIVNSEDPGSGQQDFRTKISSNPNSKYIMSSAPNYNPGGGKTYEGTAGSRLNITSPGLRGDRSSYTAGKIIGRTEQGTGGRVSVVDRINFQPIYQSKAVSNEENGVYQNDLVKFRIAAINKNDSDLKQFLHFRAFINSFSDAYGVSWSGQKYMGRGEELFKYGGFTRNLNISFTVAALSKPELMAQYKKLNFLASNLAPTYSNLGYMGGPLIQLTMGGWCYELPGFLTSLNLEVPNDTPWEIGINDNATDFDNTVKEMPHRVNCTMAFTPIHKFRPEKQVNAFNGPEQDNEGNDISPENREGEVGQYGPQRYIQLTNGQNNNYVAVSLNDAEKATTSELQSSQFTKELPVTQE